MPRRCRSTAVGLRYGITALLVNTRRDDECSGARFELLMQSTSFAICRARPSTEDVEQLLPTEIASCRSPSDGSSGTVHAASPTIASAVCNLNGATERTAVDNQSNVLVMMAPLPSSPTITSNSRAAYNGAHAAT